MFVYTVFRRNLKYIFYNEKFLRFWNLLMDSYNEKFLKFIDGFLKVLLFSEFNT